MSLEIFRKYPTLDEASLLIDVLKNNDITYKLEDYSKNVDINMLGQNLDLKILVKANLSDFPRIEKLLDEEYNLTLEQVDKEHYLFEFTDEELTEIIMKPNDWSNYDYKVSELLLNKRGVPVSSQLIENIKKQRYNQLNEKESISSIWVILGYASALLGGLLGFAIGLGLWRMKKKTPNGEKIYIYDETNRKHGERITYIGVAMVIFYFIIYYKVQ